MPVEFPYRLDRRTRRLSRIITSAVVLAGVLLGLYSRDNYFPMWLLFFGGTVLLLYLLSIPRKIRVTERVFEIHCVVELTSIALEDIATIREMEPGEMRRAMPLLASYGFWGYYGWYYDLSEFSLLKVYASRWGNFVRIEDIYETVYVVSCDDPAALIGAVTRAQAKIA